MTDKTASLKRRIIVPLLAGIIGCAILASLGVWQLQRLAWKEAVLAEIDARIADDAVAIPAMPDRVADRLLPVRVSGATTGEEARVLVSVKGTGAGFRVISPFVTEDGRRILLDEGFIRTTEKDVPRPATEMTVIGNLHWPDEIDSFTPDPSPEDGLWFARDVDILSEWFQAEPILVIARTVSGTDARATPLPVTSEGIPNNHLGYAVQWFGLAIVWAGMTLFLLWRIRRRTI